MGPVALPSDNSSGLSHALSTAAGKSLEVILGKCDDLRSQVEHLHDWQNALLYFPLRILRIGEISSEAGGGAALARPWPTVHVSYT